MEERRSSLSRLVETQPLNSIHVELQDADIPTRNLTVVEAKHRLQKQFDDKVSVAMAMGIVLGKPVLGTKNLVTQKVSLFHNLKTFNQEYKRCLELIPKLSYEEIRKAQDVENWMKARNVQIRDRNIIAQDQRSNPPDMGDPGFMFVHAGKNKKPTLLPDYHGRNVRNQSVLV